MNKLVAKKIDDFFSKYPVKKYKKGQVLIYRGEEPEGIYHLISGRIRQYDISNEGEEVVVNIYQPPAFLPMQWAINKTKNLYFFDAITPLTLHKVPAEEVLDFLRQNPDVVFDLLSRLYSGTDGLLRRMAHLMTSDASTRVLFELIMESKRFAYKQKDGAYIIPMHEYEIAKIAGLSRETVSRELAKLKRAGMIEVTRKNIKVTNLKKLEGSLEGKL